MARTNWPSIPRLDPTRRAQVVQRRAVQRFPIRPRLGVGDQPICTKPRPRRRSDAVLERRSRVPPTRQNAAAAIHGNLTGDAVVGSGSGPHAKTSRHRSTRPWRCSPRPLQTARTAPTKLVPDRWRTRRERRYGHSARCRMQSQPLGHPAFERLTGSATRPSRLWPSAHGPAWLGPDRCQVVAP